MSRYLLSYLSIAAAVCYMALGSFALKQEPASRPNRLLFLLCLSLGIWSFAYAFVYHAESVDQLWFWFRISSIGWCLLGGICLHFLMALTQQDRLLKNGWMYLLLYAPGTIILFQAMTGTVTAKEFVYTQLGWIEIPATGSGWLWGHTLNLIICVMTGIWLTWRWGCRSRYRREKIQSRIIILTILISLVSGILINILFPVLHILHIPAVAQIGCLFWGFGVWIAIVRYRMLVFTPAIATQEIVFRMQDILILTGPDGNIIQVNPQIRRVLGYSESDLIGKPVHRIIPNNALVSDIVAILNDEHQRIPDTETDFISASGTRIPVNLSSSTVKDQMGDLIGAVLVAQDIRPVKRLEDEIATRLDAEARLQESHARMELVIAERTADLARTNRSLEAEITERKKSEMGIRDSELRYRTLFVQCQEMILVLRGSNIVDANPAAARFLDCPLDDLPGKSIFAYSPEYQPDGTPSREMGTQMVGLAIHEGPQRFEWVCRPSGGGPDIYLDVTLSRFYMGSESRLMLTAHDVTDRKRSERQMHELSLRDTLTGLYNRRGFFNLAEHSIKLAERQKTPLFLMFADMDDLKWINDTHGHQAGDQALIDLTHILKKTFRESDILARFGGDEFVILGVETGQFDRNRMIEKLNQMLEAWNSDSARSYGISISTGIARLDPHAPIGIDELIQQADNLMYDAKRIRKNSA